MKTGGERRNETIAMTNQDSVPASHSGLLTTLRDFEREPTSPAGMRRIAAAQANTLRQALSGLLHEIPACISTLIPSVIVEHIAHLPAAGISFWANHHWNIHVREEDPAEVQAFTVLHQLKRIIDHPLREQQGGLSEPEWNSLADFFAQQVLDTDPTPISKVRERRNAYERAV